MSDTETDKKPWYRRARSFIDSKRGKERFNPYFGAAGFFIGNMVGEAAGACILGLNFMTFETPPIDDKLAISAYFTVRQFSQMYGIYYMGRKFRIRLFE